MGHAWIKWNCCLFNWNLYGMHWLNRFLTLLRSVICTSLTPLKFVETFLLYSIFVIHPRICCELMLLLADCRVLHENTTICFHTDCCNQWKVLVQEKRLQMQFLQVRCLILLHIIRCLCHVSVKQSHAFFMQANGIVVSSQTAIYLNYCLELAQWDVKIHAKCYTQL